MFAYKCKGTMTHKQKAFKSFFKTEMITVAKGK